MIDAASNALEEGKIDSYSVDYAPPGYRVKVTVGDKVGEAYGDTEDKALAAAIKAADKSASASDAAAKKA